MTHPMIIFDQPELIFKLTKIEYFSAPIILYGTGSYAISDVKEVKVTEDFLGLQTNIRKCQNKERFEACTTNQFFNEALRLCKCVPYRLINFPSNKVRNANV